MRVKRKGEDGILDLIAEYFPNRHSAMPVGRGDDCALISVPYAPALGSSPLFAVTSDIFAENAHFRTAYFTPEDIGHKALAVNISDLASNGAKPLAFSLNLTLTEQQDYEWLNRFFKSMAELANSYGMVLCGGDLTRVPLARLQQTVPSGLGSAKQPQIDPLTPGGLNVGITAWGTYEHGGVPLMRHRSCFGCGTTDNFRPQMKNGDILFYIGEIGLARTGLFLLEEYMDREACLKKFSNAVTAHLHPLPKVREGMLLSEFAVKHPLFVMDISDGLMRDIPRLLACEGLVLEDEPSFGADVVLPLENVHKEIIAYCREKNLDPVHFAYKGGEDYGLVGVCAKEAFNAFMEFCHKNGIAMHKLGMVKKEKGIMLNGKSMEEAGFDHFQ